MAGEQKEFFSLWHHMKSSSEEYPASYSMGTGGSLPRGKVIGA